MYIYGVSTYATIHLTGSGQVQMYFNMSPPGSVEEKPFKIYTSS